MASCSTTCSYQSLRVTWTSRSVSPWFLIDSTCQVSGSPSPWGAPVTGWEAVPVAQQTLQGECQRDAALRQVRVDQAGQRRLRAGRGGRKIAGLGTQVGVRSD